VANQKFNLRKEQDGTWTVFETATGEPASTKSATGLTVWQAGDLAVLLNLLDVRRGDIPIPPYAYPHGDSAVRSQKAD
jgi:hypothetical protein